MNCKPKWKALMLDREILTKSQMCGIPENRFLFGKIATLTCDSDTFKDKIVAMLDKSVELNLRKKELLHKKWLNNVYYPLRGNIRCIVCNRRFEFNKCKHHLFENSIFIDDKLKECHCAIVSKSQLKKLKDPLRSEEDRKHSELCHLYNLYAASDPCSRICQRYKKAYNIVAPQYCKAFTLRN